jgi:Na+/melibiose symporter-like transporter
MFSLCFYDALFTFVLLAQCALFTELSVEQTDRVRLVRYHHAAGLIGSASVLICETMSDGLRAYGRFQMTCIGLGLAAGLCFVYTGLHSQTPFDRQKQQQQQQAGVDDDRDKKTDTMSAIQQQPSLSIAAVWRQTRQIFRQPSFVSFILMNLCQVYHMAFLHNFANIIGESLLGKDGISAAAKSIFYGSLFVIPQLLVIICAPVVSSLGYYRLIRGSFVLNISMGLLFLIVGHRHPWFVVLFFLVESASVNSMFSLFGLCLSDVIDVDMQQHQRTRPLSSMVFGLNALVTKPSISLAPMITVAILNRYGYSERQKQQQLVPSATALTTLVALDQSADSLLAAMFYTTCLVSIITGLLQLVLWRFYTIRDSHKPSYQLIFTD